MAEIADTVRFELVTPSTILLSQDVEMVVIPGGDGDFGVLPGHAPLISTLRPGIVDIYKDDRIVERVFVAGGFAEVSEGRCTVLADEAQRVADIPADEPERRLADARRHLQEAADEDARRAAEEEVRVAEIMVAATQRGGTAAH